MAQIVNDAYWVSHEGDYWGPRTLACSEDGIGCDGYFDEGTAHEFEQCRCSCHNQDNLVTQQDVIDYHTE